MNKTFKFSKNIISLLTAFILTSVSLFALGPTVAEKGEFMGIFSFQIIKAKIRNKVERVCLPKIEFDESADKTQINENIQKDLLTQNAVFNLYHDGLGRPKKENGMYYASDCFLKDLNISYITYLKRAYRASVSKEPAFKDQGFIISALSAEQALNAASKLKEGKKKSAERREKERLKASSMRVVTVFDMLPPGVLPYNIRNTNREVNKRLKHIKNRPYSSETVQIDPLRWAAGIMGVINEKGEIDNAVLEGQRVLLSIAPPAQKGALTKSLIDKIKNQPCEFILYRLKNGLEAKENNRFCLRDIYFKKLKISFEEMLKKENIPYAVPKLKAEYAFEVTPLSVKKLSGKFKALKTPVLCTVEFDKNEFASAEEVCRIAAPKTRPKSFKNFAEIFNKNFAGAKVDVYLPICPDGQVYREIGQLKALRAKFVESNLTLEAAQKMVLSGLLN